jgi:NlpC/P60 family
MFGARSILLAACLTSICVPPPAQAASRQMGLRLASPQEGEAIVQAAWELRHGLFPKPDCSHFVHAVYMQAGFLYDYAASRAIFAGIDGFRRVTKPQSGDVIVWQGHIGIVIDPKEHSFYSSVTAGFAIQSYQSRYWIGRGIPRFYRFVVSDLPGSPPLLANLALRGSASGQVLSNLTRSFPAQLPALMQSDTAQILVRSDGWESSAPESAQVRPAQTREQHPAMEDRPAQMKASEAARNDTRMTDQVLVSSRPTPGKKEVLAAVRRTVDAGGERLLRSGSLDSLPWVSVIDHVKIVAINLQGNSGFADLEVKQMGAFQYGEAVPRRAMARIRVMLSRQEQGWVAVMPQDLMCLNRDLAVMALTDHLASLPPTPANNSELKVSRRLLNELSSERKLWHPRTWFRLSRSSGKARSLPEMES